MKKTLRYLRLNFISILFTVISFMSVTLAWFAYSGISSVGADIDVKAWQISLAKDGNEVGHELIISLSEVYPGMDILTEVINITNLGDSDAKISYKIKSARILGSTKDYYVLNEMEDNSIYIEDAISHEYPFKINLSLSKNHVLAKGDEASFNVTVSWPLESGQDEFDSLWGSEAYNFQKAEDAKNKQDPTYEAKTAIQVIISLTAEQMISSTDLPDVDFKLGGSVLFDPVLDSFCSEEKGSCMKMYVIDANNLKEDSSVLLIPKLSDVNTLTSYYDLNQTYNSYTSNWTTESRILNAEDVLKIISKDIFQSFISRGELSDDLIGFLGYPGRMSSLLTTVKNSNYYFKFSNHYSFLTSNSCYWLQTEYSQEEGFAYMKEDTLSSKLYGLTKESTCNMIPVIEASK